jgi:hypothetical protein
MAYLPIYADYTIEILELFSNSCGQCCGSMKLWSGSGTADQYLWLMDPDAFADPDPAIFVSDHLEGTFRIFEDKKS